MNIQQLWNDIITQNKDRLPAYFKDDAVILWPCTNEQFTVEEYVRRIVNIRGTGKAKSIAWRNRGIAWCWLDMLYLRTARFPVML